jgi:Glyoxalase/Bleomycin resistance protein/Dioxygenase superfamily
MSDVNYQELKRVEPIVCADSILNLAFERIDPGVMLEFAGDFGLMRRSAEGDTHFLRGHGPAPYLVSVKGSNRNQFLGMALTAKSEADLQRLARATGAPIESLSTPGGGRCVVLEDPWGLKVSLVHGIEWEKPLVDEHVEWPINTPQRKARINRPVRTALRPCPLFKVGHVVMQRPDFKAAAEWYMRHFGFIPSDVQCLPDGQPGLGFFRLNRGTEPADHHTLALLGGPGANLMHVSFETLDLDAVGQGNQYLQAKGWTHYWGIGRHLLGSQVFDYWKDPVGDEWEHYADGDVMNVDYPTGYSALTRGGLWAWGDDLPDSMRPEVPLDQIEHIHASGGFGSMELSQVRGLMEALSIKPRHWMR